MSSKRNFDRSWKVDNVDIFCFLFAWSQIVLLAIKKEEFSPLFAFGYVLTVTVVERGSYRMQSLCGIFLVHNALYGYPSNHSVVTSGLAASSLVACRLSCCDGRSASSSLYLNIQGVVSRILGMIYLVAAWHKLNVEFLWNPQGQSCASQTLAVVWSFYFPSEEGAVALPDHNLLYFMLRYAGIVAFVWEAWLSYGFLFVISPLSERKGTAKHNRHVASVTLLLSGIFFHLFLALPPPPASFYPFSFYVLVFYLFLIPEIAFSCWKFHAVMAALASLATQIFWTQSSKMTEYPPYNLYLPARFLLCCFSFFLAVVLLTSAATCHPSDNFKKKKKHSTKLLHILAITFVAAFGLLGPLLGLRTHPALAMFSNLRIEGSQTPNHFFMRSTITPQFVTIEESNIPRLRNYEVDLAQFYPPHVTASLLRLNITPCLIINPPPKLWPKKIVSSASNRQTSFSIPFQEFRRLLYSDELVPSPDEDDHPFIFLRFHRNRTHTMLFNLTNNCYLSRKNQWQAVAVHDASTRIEEVQTFLKQELSRSPSAWERFFVFRFSRFRSFDDDSKVTKCRH